MLLTLDTREVLVVAEEQIALEMVDKEQLVKDLMVEEEVILGVAEAVELVL
jgi:hypothetical protein